MDVGKNSRESSSKSSVLFRGIDSVRGIIAQELEKQFVEQGIVGQPLLVRKLKTNYSIYCIKICQFINSDKTEYYFLSDKQPEPPELSDTYWTPAAIPKHIWNLAISRFSYRRTLATNIKKYLLPQFDSVLNLFSYDEIRSIVTRAFLKNGILMKPVRIANHIAYYFDANQIYQKDADGRWQTDKRNRRLWFCWEIDMRIFSKASCKFQIGSTLSDCVDMILKTDLYTISAQYSPLELLVTRVGPILYERVPENQDPETVDFIRVQANLSHTFYATWEDLRQGIEQRWQEIDNLVMEQIKNDPGFQKFRIPLDAFKLSNRILSRSYFLEYIFDLKDMDSSD